MPTNTQGQWFSTSSGADLGDTIEQSLRFSGSQYLSRTFGTATDQRKFTLSGWMKPALDGHDSSLGGPSVSLLGTDSGSANQDNYGIYTTSIACLNIDGSGTYSNGFNNGVSRAMRDPSAWYHYCVAVDSTLANAADRVILWINGERQLGNLATYPLGLNVSPPTNSGARAHYIGRYNGNIESTGYMAAIYFIDGQGLDVTNFGKYNDDGVWVPQDYTGTYGNNGYKLTFDSSQPNGIGHDSSGNGNNWTATGFDTAAISSSNPDNDVDFLDTPTSNYATLNPLDGSPYNDPTRLNAANLEHNSTYWGAAYHNKVNRPILPGDKLYIEIYIIRRQTSPNILYPHFQFEQVGTYTSRSQYADGTGYFSGVDAWPTGSVVRLKLNGDNQTIQIAVNNGSFTSDLDLNFTGPFTVQMTNTDAACQFNFGQMPFIYSVPTGYTAMSTGNLPEPTIKNGKEHFNTVLWTGDGTNGRDITGLDFQPDLVWIKRRNGANQHNLYDSVRGVTLHLTPDNTYGDQTTANSLTAFNSDGFQVGTGASDNTSGSTYVGWCWKAGGTATTIPVNSITASTPSIASSVSANTDAGFSIVSYTGNGTAGATIGHGLTQAPEWILFRNRTSGSLNWLVYHKYNESSFGAADGHQRSLILNTAAAGAAESSMLNNTAPDNSVITLGSAAGSNGSTTMMAYCWHSVEGFSKFGAYTGNGNASDNAFVYTGFSVAWLLLKRVDSGTDWVVFDSTRDTANPNETWLIPNKNDTESVGSDASNGSIDIDFLSNGFEIKSNSGTVGAASAARYVYMAFAENPFGGENVPPATAR